MDKKTGKLLHDPVFPLLLRMSAPNTVAFLIQAIVVLAEIWFLSKLGTTSLAAIALAFPVVMLTQQMAHGALGGAVSSSIARSLGSDDVERAENLIWHSIVISSSGALILLVSFLLLGEYILIILGGTGELLKESLAYCLVFLSGGFLIWISGSLGAVIRGSGDMRFPALMMIFSSGLQVFFSAGFILGWYGFPKLGIVGAALSALISAGFLTLMMILKLNSKSSLVKLNFSRLSFKKDLFEDIFNVALPASLSPFFTVGTILALTGLVGQFGESALAGYGIGSRVEFLMIPLVFGIGTAMTTMVGTNMGAKNIERSEHIGFLGGIFAGALSGFIGLVLALTPDLWINLFASDEATYLVTKQYIQIVGICYLFQGLGLSIYFASQGASAMKWPIVATVVRFIVAALGGWVTINYFSLGLNGIFYSAAAGMTLFGLIIVISLKLGAWRNF